MALPGQGLWTGDGSLSAPMTGPLPAREGHIIRLAENQMSRSSVVDSNTAGSRVDSIRTARHFSPGHL